MTSTIKQIAQSDVPASFGWAKAVAALKAGHRLPQAQIKDQFLSRGDDAFMTRAAWIEGLGIGVKSFTVFPGNAAKGLPSVQGAMQIFDEATGAPVALVASDVVTYWKTAADSVLGALLLARPDSRHLLVVGTGIVASSLILAYGEMFPKLERITIWGRNPDNAAALAMNNGNLPFEVRATSDLAAAAAAADIITSATMAKTPILNGDWLREGTHVDLIGAFKSDMREADDRLLKRGRLFVDSFDTTLAHIGELSIPLAEGTITRDDVLGDFYDLVAGKIGRVSDRDITVFKNGGGAHLDLMTAMAIVAG
ncbi:ornithine cyclodeaminase family protein [Maritimibacter sp. DP1N21-5]|uniref:ornithine cyclodeaminase family protein n=1 Tax=Maritimibacter sp. DP1N21-5 TaxID=2836867 RepID=UPI001C4480BC|nr:ornithine cyclodeaminase [Maritimibacter sp. DP1N21-5]MBV7408501.1 ornithine cyclodeaminase [Maritimibacter sp. DP1N21-5]